MRAPSDANLARCLDALSSPTRLAIMRALRAPRTLREVRVRSDEGEAPLSRQAVRKHLDRLIEAGVVATLAGEREYGDATEFVVNHQRVFAVSEDHRDGLSRREAQAKGGP